MGQASREEFIGRFKSFEGMEGENAPVAPPGKNTVMPWVRFAGMTREDLGAIYDYLKTLTPIQKKINSFPDARRRRRPHDGRESRSASTPRAVSRSSATRTSRSREPKAGEARRPRRGGRRQLHRRLPPHRPLQGGASRSTLGQEAAGTVLCGGPGRARASRPGTASPGPAPSGRTPSRPRSRRTGS